MSCKMSPLTYFKFAINQLPNEPSEQIIGDAISQIAELIDNYIPLSLISDCKDKMLEILKSLLNKASNEELKVTIADKIFEFISCKESVNLTLSWIEKGYIYTIGSPEVKVFYLNQSIKRSICETLFKSSYISTERKMNLLEHVLKDDQSDIARDCRAQCMASIADSAIK